VRVSLIVNPLASSVSPSTIDAIVDALSVRHDLEVVATTARGDASSMARVLADAGVEVVVVTDTALAPLPGGSTNVFARALGIEFTPLDACAQLLASLDAGPRRRIGIGAAVHGDGTRHFLFHLGLGFDAAVVREMEERHAHLKRLRLAHPAFAMTAVDTWARRYERDTRIDVTAAPSRNGTRTSTTTVGGGADATRVAHGPYVVVSNCDPYTYVGHRPVTIAPDADLDRALAVTTFRSLELPLLVRAGTSGLSGARFLAASPDIAQFAEVGHVELACDRPTPWQVDGDHLGSTTHLQVRYEPECLTLVTPATPRARGRARR
jgi:diacylglycerol kinase family enzyme